VQGKHPYLDKLVERRGSRNRGSERVLDRAKSGMSVCMCVSFLYLLKVFVGFQVVTTLPWIAIWFEYTC